MYRKWEHCPTCGHRTGKKWTDYEAIYAEYMAGGTTYKKLAAKYDRHPNAIYQGIKRHKQHLAAVAQLSADYEREIDAEIEAERKADLDKAHDIANEVDRLFEEAKKEAQNADDGQGR